MTSNGTKRPRVMSGMRPSGFVHLGHLVGVLTQWANYSETADAFFEIADLHAYTTDFDDPAKIRGARNAMVAAWLAAGVDPERSTIFLQSGVPEIGELQTLLAMIMPISWLERVPTYKGQIEALGQKIATYGFLGYPLLQLCDIAVFRGEYVPVGRDQVAHLEFGREIVRRFNHLYGDGATILVEPQATLSEFPEVPGTDGRKMSKSYDNAIFIGDDEETTTKKVRAMVTDPLKVRRGDPGATGDLSRLRPVALRQSAQARRHRRRMPFGRARLRARQDGLRQRAQCVSASGARALRGVPRRSRRRSSASSPTARNARARSRPACWPTSNAQCNLFSLSNDSVRTAGLRPSISSGSYDERGPAQEAHCVPTLARPRERRNRRSTRGAPTSVSAEKAVARPVVTLSL